MARTSLETLDLRSLRTYRQQRRRALTITLSVGALALGATVEITGDTASVRP